jgi:glycosyltransferase involved in cell wall biosynthesis
MRPARRAERRALAMARVVIANSERTRRDVLAVVPGAAERVHTVYLGTDPDAFRPLDAGDAVRARERLAVPVSGPIVTFIGALGHDRNKGFDVLFDAWRTLCAEPAWDAHLLVAGAGAEVELWRQRSRCAGLDGRVHLLGFTSEPATVLAASDVLVSPTHYDGYGLAVHEALCRGIPAFVTDAAGVAERYPPELGDLVWAAPAHAGDVVRGLRAWRADVASYRDRIRPFADRLRRRHWRDMARDIVELIEARVPAESRP